MFLQSRYTGIVVLVAIIPALAAFWLPADTHPIQFTESAQQAGLHAEIRCGGPEKQWIPEANGSGVAWLDFDRDGLMDLLIVNGSTMERLRRIVSGEKPAPLNGSVYLFRNLGNGHFEDVTGRSGLANPYWGTGANAADFNNDGYPDILITNIGADLLYRNNGDGTFTEVGAMAGLSREVAWHTGSAFGDFDGDGYLDLWVSGYVDIRSISLASPAPICPYQEIAAFCGPIGLKPQRGTLYHNNRDGTFRDVTTGSGIDGAKASHSFSAVFDDFNQDGKIDLFVANDSDPNFLFLNQGHGKFKDVALELGVGFNANGAVQANMGVAVGDFENKGRLGILTTTFFNDYFPLFRQDKAGDFDDISSATGLNALTRPLLGWACGFADFDNDGRKDLWLGNGHVYPRSKAYNQPVSVLRNNSGRWSQAYQFPDAPKTSYRGGATADYDNDGRMDIVILPIAGPPALLHNTTSTVSSWIGLDLRGTASNRDAIGASVHVSSCGIDQFETVRNGGSYLSRSDPRLHFGLGSCATADRLTITWPSGARQEVANPPINRYLTMIEPR